MRLALVLLLALMLGSVAPASFAQTGAVIKASLLGLLLLIVLVAVAAFFSTNGDSTAI